MNGKCSLTSGSTGFRSDRNEKRAKSLFDLLGNSSGKSPKWDNQPDRIKNIFREAATYNTYKHMSGTYYGWTFHDTAYVFVKVDIK